MHNLILHQAIIDLNEYLVLYAVDDLHCHSKALNFLLWHPTNHENNLNHNHKRGRIILFLQLKYLPEIMFRSAIVQYMNEYSDRDMEEAARYNLIIKWFLGIPIEDHSYDHSILGDFRDRLGENKWKELFFIILKQIEDAGFAKENQSADATHVIANIAIPGTIGLIRQGIKAIMEEIETV